MLCYETCVFYGIPWSASLHFLCLSGIQAFPGILEEMKADLRRNSMLQISIAIVVFVKMDSHLSGFICPDKSSVLSLGLDNWVVFLLRE